MSASKFMQHFIRGGLGQSICLYLTKSPNSQLIRTFTNNARSAIQPGIKRRSLKEILLAPAGQGAFTLGRGALIGGSALGLTALCYYGLGLSKEIGAIDKAIVWPKIVKERIQNTYLYFGGSLLFTAGSAYYVARNATLMNMFARTSLLSIGLTFVAVIASGALCRSIPYNSENFLVKHGSWILHNGVLGAMVAPMTVLGGPLILRAAVYTAGIVGGLSMVAACAPSDKFLTMSGPLAIGLGTVFVASLGGMFLPPTTALGAGLYSISVYGGLLLFSAFLLYDTQKIVKLAENYPTHKGVTPFDPINASMGIYLDTLNIFMRLAMVLAGGSNRRK